MTFTKPPINTNIETAPSLRFSHIRTYISCFDKLSICNQDTLSYENFSMMSQVPHTYDDYYLYGIGMKDIEFSKEQLNPYDLARLEPGQTSLQCSCLEIVVSKNPKEM